MSNPSVGNEEDKRKILEKMIDGIKEMLRKIKDFIKGHGFTIYGHELEAIADEVENLAGRLDDNSESLDELNGQLNKILGRLSQEKAGLDERITQLDEHYNLLPELEDQIAQLEKEKQVLKDFREHPEYSQELITALESYSKYIEPLNECNQKIEEVQNQLAQYLDKEFGNLTEEETEQMGLLGEQLDELIIKKNNILEEKRQDKDYELNEALRNAFSDFDITNAKMISANYRLTPAYEKNPDGSYQLDEKGEKIPRYKKDENGNLIQKWNNKGEYESIPEYEISEETLKEVEKIEKKIQSIDQQIEVAKQIPNKEKARNVINQLRSERKDLVEQKADCSGRTQYLAYKVEKYILIDEKTQKKTEVGSDYYFNMGLMDRMHLKTEKVDVIQLVELRPAIVEGQLTFEPVVVGTDKMIFDTIAKNPMNQQALAEETKSTLPDIMNWYLNGELGERLVEKSKELDELLKVKDEKMKERSTLEEERDKKLQEIDRLKKEAEEMKGKIEQVGGNIDIDWKDNPKQENQDKTEKEDKTGDRAEH